MSSTYEEKDIKQIFADITSRLRRLESGGRPIIGISSTVRTTITLAAGEAAEFSNLLEWPVESVPASLGAVPYLSIHVDLVTPPENLWPQGSALTAGQKNLLLSWIMDLDHLEQNNNKAMLRGLIRNLDSAGHTYYIDMAFTYVAGASSSQ